MKIRKDFNTQMETRKEFDIQMKLWTDVDTQMKIGKDFDTPAVRCGAVRWRLSLVFFHLWVTSNITASNFELSNFEAVESADHLGSSALKQI